MVDSLPAALRRSVADPARKAADRWVRLANAADRILGTPGGDPGDAEPVGRAIARLIAVGNRQLEAGLHAVEIGHQSRLIQELSEVCSASRKVKLPHYLGMQTQARRSGFGRAPLSDLGPLPCPSP
jgi:hypothetical protein